MEGQFLNLDDVKVLIFDFGGVLINLSRQCSVDRLKQLGVFDADRLLDNYVQSGLFLDLEAGNITPEQFRLKLRNDYRLKDVTDQDIDDAFLAFLLDVPDAKLDLLRRLHNGVFNKRGEKIRIVMLSNTNAIHFPYCVKTHFEKDGHAMNEYFDKLYLSYEMKMSKPDKEIFNELLKQENVEANECLFLDDGPANIESANNMGFQTYLVKVHEDITKLFNI